MEYRSKITKGFLGSEIPNFRNYPFKATEVLRLYRSFWRVLVRLPPEDQTEAKYKVRDSFRRARGVVGPKSIAKALSTGYSKLEQWKSIVEASETRSRGAWKSSTDAAPKNKNQIDFSAPADEVWERIKVAANATLPGVEGVRGSRPVTQSLLERRTGRRTPTLWSNGYTFMSYDEVDIASLRRDLAVTRTSLLQRADEAAKATAQWQALHLANTQMHEAAPRLWGAMQSAAMTECANFHLQASLNAMRQEAVTNNERMGRLQEEGGRQATERLAAMQSRAEAAEAKAAVLSVENVALRQALDAAVQRVPNMTAVVQLTEATATLDGLRAVLRNTEGTLADLRRDLAACQKEGKLTAEAVRGTAALYSSQQRLVVEYERMVKGISECAGKVDGAALHAQLWAAWGGRQMTAATLCGALSCRGVPNTTPDVLARVCPQARPDNIQWPDFLAVMKWADSMAPPPNVAVKEAVERIGGLWRDIQSHRTALMTCRECPALRDKVSSLETAATAAREEIAVGNVQRAEALRRRGVPGTAAMLVALLEVMLIKPVGGLTTQACLQIVYSVTGVKDAVEFYEATAELVETEYDGNASVLYPVLMNAPLAEVRRVIAMARPRTEVALLDYALRYVLYAAPTTTITRDVLGSIRFVWLPQRVLASLQASVAVWAKSPGECLCRGNTASHQHVCVPLQDYVTLALECKSWLRSPLAENASSLPQNDFRMRASYVFASKGVVDTAERMSTNEVAPSDVVELREMQRQCDAC